MQRFYQARFGLRSLFPSISGQDIFDLFANMQLNEVTILNYLGPVVVGDQTYLGHNIYLGS
jgi:hypothetical protein